MIHECLDQGNVLALNAAADFYLNGTGWSGSKRTFEALAMGFLVVTCPGEFMRARHNAAMTKTVVIDDTLAA